MNENQILINQYFDDELTNDEEALLFKLLAADPEAREYFSRMKQLKNIIQEENKDLPFETELKIYNSIKSSAAKTKKYKWLPVFAAAASILLLITSIFAFMMLKDYNRMFENLSSTVIKQNEMIELLIHSLPAAEITSKPENEIVIHAKL